MTIKKIYTFFDKLEDKIRFHLSRYPIVYALIGAIGIILVWKGIWETAELFPVLHGPMSVVLGVIILLASGLLVSFFIGDSIILSGYKHEKKLAEKTESEVHTEKEMMEGIAASLAHLEKDLEEIKKETGHTHPHSAA